MVAAVIALYVLWAFLLLLIARLVMSYVFVFARDFRPSGYLAAGLEVVYSVTDPPLRVLRRVLPPLRLGRTALDVSFLVVIITTYALIDVVKAHT